jgi:hypothetical protein
VWREETFKHEFGGEPEGKRLRESPGVNGKLTLTWIFKELDGEAWVRLIWLGIGTGDGLL